MNHKELKAQLLENEDLRKAYQEPDFATAIGDMICDNRIRLGLTQTELAERCGTTQSSIARIENGDQVPTIKTLNKIATDGFGAKLILPQIDLSGTTCSSVDYKIKEDRSSGLFATLRRTFTPALSSRMRVSFLN